MEIELYIYLLGALYTLGRYISESEKVWTSRKDLIPCVTVGIIGTVFWPIWLGYLSGLAISEL